MKTTAEFCQIGEHERLKPFARQPEYLSVFAQPDDVERPHCVKCKSELIFTFRWGLAHGEGVCSKCLWPTRLYHFLKGDDGSEKRIVQLLQYHPSLVTRRKSA